MIDDEHSSGARITLEKNTRIAPFAITCGIYGWMVHTRFIDEDLAAKRAVEDMKRDIEAILSGVPVEEDPALDAKTALTLDAIRVFFERYPT